MPARKAANNVKKIAPAAAWATITLRTDKGDAVAIQSSEKLQRAAMEWRAVVRNRRRWADARATREEKARTAQAQLLLLGVEMADLKRLAAARVIEVSVPFTNEESGWEARVFPWEYVLSGAARSLRSTAALTVVRHLDCSSSTPNSLRPPQKLLFVESAPGRLLDAYTFDTERRLVTASLNLPQSEVSRDATRAQLRDAVAGFQPEVIHLAGFDAHQAVALSVIKTESQRSIKDGYLMATERAEPELVEAESLAETLNGAGATPPVLVGCNLYNSAGRICALTVADGAGAALGFQDEFDDSLAEIFFANFYAAWRTSGWDLLAAFRAAGQSLREQQANLHGTGVVLWSRQSLLERSLITTARRRRRTEAPAAFAIDAVIANADVAAQKLRANQSVLLRPETDRASLLFDIKPLDELNYSMLHNNRELFERFKIGRERDGRVEALNVEVTLYVGESAARYSARHDMPEKLLELSPEIRVPLLHTEWANLRERVRTSLGVVITWEGVEVYRSTHRVWLLPLDQWRDDDRDRVWLPSFVLPRDPAVSQLVDEARRYLMALRDDAAAGFDGYQSFDPQLRAHLDDAAASIDDQVRAIWAALVYDHSLGYINPPPTYSSLSQRLRSPSEIISGRRGTCIDTTLLLAACLEYVEIYPIIFLLSGHAFAGYWRYADYRDEFVRAASGLTREPTDTPREEEADKEVEQYGWYYKRQAYDLIMQHVRDGKLIPLESTLLTARGAFWEAVEEGTKNLHSKREFEALIDVTQARNEVTPIQLH